MKECLFMMSTSSFFLTFQFVLVRPDDSSPSILPISLEPLLMTIQEERYTLGKQICIWGLQLSNPEVARLVSYAFLKRLVNLVIEYEHIISCVPAIIHLVVDRYAPRCSLKKVFLNETYKSAKIIALKSIYPPS